MLVMLKKRATNCREHLVFSKVYIDGAEEFIILLPKVYSTRKSQRFLSKARTTAEYANVGSLEYVIANLGSIVENCK